MKSLNAKIEDIGYVFLNIAAMSMNVYHSVYLYD